MPSSSTWILSLKVVLISSGVVGIAMVMKFSVPLIMGFAVNEVPVIWSILLSWLKPPYLFVIINGIIITIAASSRFYQKIERQNQSEPLVQAKPPPSDFAPVSTPPQRINSRKTQTRSLYPATGKPLSSSRFGHRKPVKAIPEGGRALRVAKPKRNETLENTWKAITDGRHMPLTRHLRKSDTWENHGRQGNSEPSPQMVIKSETFNDDGDLDDPSEGALALVSSSPGLAKLRKEASLSQDELNRRVEAFINKFNQEMKLQKQESLNQYMEMINRGAH